MSQTSRLRRRYTKKILTLLIPLGLTIILILFFARYIFLGPREETLIVPLANVIPNIRSSYAQVIPPATPAPKKETFQASQKLGNAITNALVGTHGSYGVVVENLKTGEGFSDNGNKTYESGSLYKLW